MCPRYPVSPSRTFIDPIYFLFSRISKSRKKIPKFSIPFRLPLAEWMSEWVTRKARIQYNSGETMVNESGFWNFMRRRKLQTLGDENFFPFKTSPSFYIISLLLFFFEQKGVGTVTLPPFQNNLLQPLFPFRFPPCSFPFFPCSQALLEIEFVMNRRDASLNRKLC